MCSFRSATDRFTRTQLKRTSIDRPSLTPTVGGCHDPNLTKTSVAVVRRCGKLAAGSFSFWFLHTTCRGSNTQVNALVVVCNNESSCCCICSSSKKSCVTEFHRLFFLYLLVSVVSRLLFVPRRFKKQAQHDQE